MVNSRLTNEIICLTVLLLNCFAVRLLLFHFRATPNDMGTFSYWFNAAIARYTAILHLCDGERGGLIIPIQRLHLLRFGSLARAFSSVTCLSCELAQLSLMFTSGVIYLFLRKYLC